jgi:hypothetical protein
MIERPRGHWHCDWQWHCGTRGGTRTESDSESEEAERDTLTPAGHQWLAGCHWHCGCGHWHWLPSLPTGMPASHSASGSQCRGTATQCHCHTATVAVVAGPKSTAISTGTGKKGRTH